MIGILSYGAYVPMPRVRVGGGERAVCGFDEDSATMAVAAGIDCLRGWDRRRVDAVFFASTTYPYREKLGASLIARALDLGREVRTADVTDTLRCGVGALRAAFDAARAGSARCALVVVSDCRTPPPGSAQERSFGDGAAAFLVGEGEQPLLTLEGACAVSDELVDVWRTDRDRFVNSWEDRFVVQHGYLDNLVAAVRGLRAQQPGEFDRNILYAPDARAHRSAAKALGIDAARLQDPLFGRLGNTGAAFALMQLVAALESAGPDQRWLLATTGDGGEALALRTGAAPAPRGSRRGLAWHLERRRELRDHAAYLRQRDLVPNPRPAPPGVSATRHFRERDQEVAFRALACRGCETLHFPAQRVCYRCHRKDDFEPVRLSDRRGRVMSYTFDYFHPSPEPPTIAGIVELEGGCRVYLQMTDATPDQLRCDLPVEMTFRKVHDAGERPNYFWKSTPCTTPSETK